MPADNMPAQKPAASFPEGLDLFRLFADGLIDYAFHTLDERGQVSSWNRGAERLFGYPADSALGRPYETFYSESSKARREPERDLEIVGERGTFEAEGWRVRRDGSVIEVYVVITALRDAQKSSCGYAVLTRDITARNKSLRTIQDQQRRLRSILDTAVDAVFIIDEQGIIESVNPAGERLFGYKGDDIVGRNVNLLMPAPFSAEHTGYIQRYLRTGEARIIGVGREVRALRKDGSTFPAELAVSEFWDGKRLFTGILRDISARKKLELAVLEIAESEQRRIGQELHDDTQQQLSALAMIARHSADSLAPLIAENPRLADIKTQVERVAKGLREATRSVREVAGSLVSRQIQDHGLPEALGRLAQQIGESYGVICRAELDDGVDVPESVTATHLYRIAQEAAHNATKHGRAQEIVIRLRRQERTLFLEVADNGTGIDLTHEPPGNGLQIMGYRAGLIGGVLDVRRQGTGGTLVTCRLPQP